MTLPSILLLALLSVGATRSAEAQDLRYATTTKMELAGAMGAMASMMPGIGDAVEQTTYMKGSLVRTDDETTTTLDDALFQVPDGYTERIMEMPVGR